MAAFVEGRQLKLKLVSAENLPVVRKFWRMKVYAVVSFNGNTMRTGADMAGETNPTWNFLAGYTVDEVAVQLPGASIFVKLWCERSLVGDMLIGGVKIGVKYLFESQEKILRYPVAGTPKGVLNICCSFGRRMAVSVPRPDAAALAELDVVRAKLKASEKAREDSERQHTKTTTELHFLKVMYQQEQQKLKEMYAQQQYLLQSMRNRDIPSDMQYFNYI